MDTQKHLLQPEIMRSSPVQVPENMEVTIRVSLSGIQVKNSIFFSEVAFFNTFIPEFLSITYPPSSFNLC